MIFRPGHNVEKDIEKEWKNMCGRKLGMHVLYLGVTTEVSFNVLYLLYINCIFVYL